MSPSPSDIQKVQLYQRTGWVPKNPLIRREFLRKCREKSTASINARTQHVSSVARFEAAVKADSIMVNLFNQAFVQASCLPGELPVKDLDELLYQLDIVVCQAPTFCFIKGTNGDDAGEPVGCPIFTLFDLLSNTQAGYDLFRMSAFNTAMKEFLDAWGTYLTSPLSSNVLNNGTEGWFSPPAMRMLELGRGTFDDTYVVPDPAAVDKGFNSWDAFFTRQLQPNARPIPNEDIAGPPIILNPCEGTVYRIAHGVKLHDRFWLKTQPYSLCDMLDESEYAPRFVGGTVYQVYLDPMDYHRWHVPITGTVVGTAVIPGTYSAALPDDNDDPHGALDRSLAWLTTAAARALVFIESDNSNIGLVCFIAIGMCEVSTCEVLVKEGDRVCAGEQMGMFHFGGSSSVLILGPQTKLTFEQGVKEGSHQLVNSALARVRDENAPTQISNKSSWFSGMLFW